MSLRRLLESHLWPYRRLLLLVVVLQSVQTFATLTLPTLNADLINNGVLAGDNAYIWRTGAIMLAFSFVQIVFAIIAVRFGARVSMAFGRDVRRDLFHQVTDFSAREVGRFGAPSLITRITNDVQQIQIVIVMFTTMMVAAPITMVIGVILAAPRRRRAVDRARRRDPDGGDRARPRDRAHGAGVPGDADSGSTASTPCSASRSPASASCARSCASRRSRLASPTPTPG